MDRANNIELLENTLYVLIFCSIFNLISILVPPMMWVPDQQMSAVHGSEEVTLVCHVEAHPEALTFWEKGGRMLQSGGRYSMNTLRQTPSYKVSL